MSRLCCHMLRSFSVFTFVGALWPWVDYRAKQMSPWENMARRQTTVSKSVFIDYLTPTQPETLWKSLRNRDGTADFAALGSALVTLIIVISTGLFNLDHTPVTQTSVKYNIASEFTSKNTSLQAVGSMPAYPMIGLQ